MTTTTESVLAPFAGKLERWNGNITYDDSAFRADGAFLFRLDRCAERRGTHRPNPYRPAASESMVEERWGELLETATHEWSGEWVPVDDYGTKDGVKLIADDGSEAYVDEGYLALAHRIAAPDRVTFTASTAHRLPRAPVVVFWRDGEPVAVACQLLHPSALPFPLK